jgi:hypothetical protein
MMSREQQTYLDLREAATRHATDLVRAYYDDPDAWVRLLISAGTGDETTYHFDVYWPTWGEQSRVLVQRQSGERWTVTFAEEPPAIVSPR